MEELFKSELNTKQFKPVGSMAYGCINQGRSYMTDNGIVFVKSVKNIESKQMCESEYTCLSTLEKTKTIRVPHPIKIIDGSNNETTYLVMEFVKLNSSDKYSSILGEKLADLHLHNETVAITGTSELPYVKNFGFDRSTYVGSFSFDNTWCDNWPMFYARTRLDSQIKTLEAKTGNRELGELWSELQLLIPKYFESIEVKPALIHGDLWSGNASETNDEPIIYDPGCVYAHHEFEMAMTNLFGGFSKSFYAAYYKKIPKSRGYSTREKLYKLFHVLNHWNHFGSHYKSQSISLIKELINTNFPLK